ncbi:hypothetical protein [Candidatus Tisiphia endosymbiont of Beris chalybata]|uniref:hypothetical protein n=1 Tax=Candidatus Tisiphia endosymbiont of Beris chalybata TaxID=3066262 RepID=UPI00312CBCFB
MEIYFLHKSKIVKEFLEKTKPSRTAYEDIHGERRQVLATKLPTSSTYAESIMNDEGASADVST